MLALGTYLSERLAGRGKALTLGGAERHHLQDDGRSRIHAFRDVFGARHRRLWILNASTRPDVELLPDGFAGAYNVSAYDKFGRRLPAELLTYPRPRLDVEVGGSLEIGAG